MLRCRLLVLFGLILCSNAHAQELFVYTEPSSNMPARSVGIRLSNWLLQGNSTLHTGYHFLPEIMWGVNKRLMLHAEGYFSNMTGTFKTDGAGAYAKYRFYSKDQVYRHFRMAAFVRGAVNNTPVRQEEIATNSYNTGYQAGLIGTQLLHKTAVSVTTYYERALDNLSGNEFPAMHSQNAVNYDLSAGRLILPKKYTGYNQTNLNLMVELLGQSLLDNGKRYEDIAVAMQFILHSQTRVDIGYKRELYSDMVRTSPNGVLVRVEHLLYNVF